MVGRAQLSGGAGVILWPGLRLFSLLFQELRLSWLESLAVIASDHGQHLSIWGEVRVSVVFLGERDVEMVKTEGPVLRLSSK